MRQQQRPTALSTIGADDKVAAETVVVERFARFIVDARRQGVPGTVRHEARRAVLNALAASLDATDHQAVEISRQMSLDRQPAPDAGGARILWASESSVPEDAAFVNATMIHVLDFDDTYFPTLTHPTPVVLAAVLALGEQLSASFDRVLSAFAIGVQIQLVTAELLFPSHYDRGFHITGTAGAVGAAAGCAALRELPLDATCNALGVAMSGGSGLIEMFGSMTKAFHIANAARLGVLASDLAARGYTSSRTAFEGRRGMLRSMSDEPVEKIDSVLGLLDERWLMLSNSYKRYPTGQGMHSSVECVLNLRARVGESRVPDIEVLRVKVPPFVEQTAGRFPAGSMDNLDRPTAVRPTTNLEAKFNLQFCMAAAWHAGRLTEAELSESNIRNPEVLDLRDKCVVVGDPNIPMERGELEAVFRDGRVERELVVASTGSVENPMSDDDLRTKFQVSAAGRLSPELRESVDAFVWTAGGEPVDDLLDLLGQQSGPTTHTTK